MFRRALAAIAGTMLLLAPACGGGGDEDAAGDGGTTTVTVGVIPIVDVAPIYLGDQQGFFEERGIDLQMETAQGGAALLPGVTSGQFQFGFSNVTSLLIAQNQGLGIQVVANGNNSTGQEGADFGAVVVPEDSPIQDAADLEGATVAVNTLENIGTTTVNASVREAGGDPSQVEYTELELPDMPAALSAGRVDAAWVVEPFLTITAQENARPVAWNFVDTAPDLMIAAYFTSDEYAEQNPDVVEAFAAAVEESLQYARENEDEIREVVPTYTEIDENLIQELTLPVWPSEINRDAVETLNELAVEDGLIEEPVDLDQLLP
ncbi:MAG: PhnD/SsuA/transferrin family substrate-binding protein [Propionibacteriales bacterium]|nr:PhnD/SsuA/transferrin family substrate-binding protein [Propionibacteriales bacterium]